MKPAHTKRPTTADLINQLIHPIRETTRMEDGTTHTTWMPSLIDQLDETHFHNTAGATLQSGTESKPPINLNAVALLQRITKESKATAKHLGIKEGDLKTRLSRIAGETATSDDSDVYQQARSWVTTARIIANLDTKPYKPNVPCPNMDCERRSTLQIHLETQTATCTECGSYWDQEQSSQLGNYIRWAAEHLNGAKHWLTDADGYPTECVECLSTRQEMAERSAERRRKTSKEHAA